MLVYNSIMSNREIPDPNGERRGQSEATRAWVARREATALAIKKNCELTDSDNALKHRQIKENFRGNPLPFLIGALVLIVVMVSLLWLLIDRLQCDPMWSNRGLSALCKPPPM